MKQVRRIKGINFNYDLPDFLYIVGLDKQDVPMIQKIEVVGITRTKLVKLKNTIKVKPVSKMHWDAVCKSQGKKTIPHKSIGEDPLRGFVFTQERFAIHRIGSMRDKLTKEIYKLMEMEASISARHDRYLADFKTKKKPPV